MITLKDKTILKSKIVSETPLKEKMRIYDYQQIPDPPKGFSVLEGVWIAIALILFLIAVSEFFYFLIIK